jgi:hypothetical protein
MAGDTASAASATAPNRNPLMELSHVLMLYVVGPNITVKTYCNTLRRIGRLKLAENVAPVRKFTITPTSSTVVPKGIVIGGVLIKYDVFGSHQTVPLTTSPPQLDPPVEE